MKNLELFILLNVIFSIESVQVLGLDCDDKIVPENFEVRLKRKLFCNGYDSELRPGKDGEKTMLNFRFRVKTFDFSDHDRIFTVTSWMTMQWKDFRLTWTPEEYDGIVNFHIGIESLWNPDIFLYNSQVSTSSGACSPSVDCLIAYDSNVTCVMPCEHKGHCFSGDYSNWPFDRQNCTYTFGSWMKTGEELNYNTDKVKLYWSRAKKHNQWQLLSATSKVNIGKYDIAPNETYPSVFLSFLIERHSGYHTSGTLVPALILVICNLAILWITPGSVERFIVCLANLFSHFIYMEFLYWMLPYCGDSVPSVLTFFRDSQIIVTFLLVQTIVMKLLIANLNTLKPYLWLQTSVTFATHNAVGEFLLTSTAPEVEDPAHLVERQKSLTGGDVIWMTFCKLLDRVLFIVLIVTYIMMALTLMPNGYLNTKYDPIEEY